MKSAMRNLTLASAKHLLTQGHISPGHHKRIMKKMKAPAATQQPMPVDPTAALGSLNPMDGAPMGMLSGPPEEM